VFYADVVIRVHERNNAFKNDRSVIIYLSSCCSKPVGCNFEESIYSFFLFNDVQ